MLDASGRDGLRRKFLVEKVRGAESRWEWRSLVCGLGAGFHIPLLTELGRVGVALEAINIAPPNGAKERLRRKLDIRC